MNSSRCLSAALLLPLLLASCRDADVTAYRVPKETVKTLPPSTAAHAHDMTATPAAASPGSGGGMANTAVAVANGAALTWTAPAAWRAVAGSAMRKATFAIGAPGGAAADLAVTAFPGDVGGEVANVNRWRGQIQLPPVGDAEVAASVTRFEANGLNIAVVDLAGGSSRMLGAIVPFGGATWFFKLLGPDALVAAEKPVFLEFLRTLRAADAAATAPTPTTSTP